MEMMKLPQQNDGRRRSAVREEREERKTDVATYLESLQHEKLGSWQLAQGNGWQLWKGSDGAMVMALQLGVHCTVLGSVSSSTHKLPSK